MNQEYEENPVTALGGAPVKLLIIVGALIYALTLLIGAYERQVGTVEGEPSSNAALSNSVYQTIVEVRRLGKVQKQIIEQVAVRTDVIKINKRLDDMWTIIKAIDGVEVTDGTNAPSTNVTEKVTD